MKVAGIHSALLVLAAVLAGCSHDRDEFEPSAGGNDCITFSLTVPFSAPATRIDNQGHEEVDSTFPSFEDFINPNDIGIFVFLGEEENAPLVGKWTLLADSKDPSTGMTGYGSYYVITLRMTRDDLKKVDPDIDIGPQSTNTIKFRVVTLANEKLDKRLKNDYSTYKECTTYAALIQKAYGNNLSLGTSFYYTVNGAIVGSIPMFGMRLFEVRADELYYTRPDDIVDLGDIYMLRCLVKVRLVDKTLKDGQGYPKISCDKKETGNDGGLNYIYRQAYNLPLNAIRYQNGTQMENIHLCTNYLSPSYVGNIKNTDMNIPEVVYSSYCPEQLVGSHKGAQYPLFTFSYRMAENEPWKTRTVSLNGIRLPDGTFGLIRNHIYTVEVTNEAATRSAKSSTLHVRVSDSTPPTSPATTCRTAASGAKVLRPSERH